MPIDKIKLKKELETVRQQVSGRSRNPDSFWSTLSSRLTPSPGVLLGFINSAIGLCDNKSVTGAEIIQRFTKGLKTRAGDADSKWIDREVAKIQTSCTALERTIPEHETRKSVTFEDPETRVYDPSSIIDSDSPPVATPPVHTPPATPLRSPSPTATIASPPPASPATPLRSPSPTATIASPPPASPATPPRSPSPTGEKKISERDILLSQLEEAQKNIEALRSRIVAAASHYSRFYVDLFDSETSLDRLVHQINAAKSQLSHGTPTMFPWLAMHTLKKSVSEIVDCIHKHRVQLEADEEEIRYLPLPKTIQEDAIAAVKNFKKLVIDPCATMQSKHSEYEGRQILERISQGVVICHYLENELKRIFEHPPTRRPPLSARNKAYLKSRGLDAERWIHSLNEMTGLYANGKIVHGVVGLKGAPTSDKHDKPIKDASTTVGDIINRMESLSVVTPSSTSYPRSRGP